jgi:hypothetical protein
VLREGGVIADGFDAELDELRALTRDAGAFLLELETRERARTGIATLKVEYNKVHGFYIEVSRAQSDKVPDDYRRRQTLKNAERYITPELKAFEDKALSAQERALAREKMLFERCWNADAARRRICWRSPPRSPRSTCWRATPSVPANAATARPSSARGARHPDPRRPPSGGRGAGRPLHPQRRPADPTAARCC